MLKDAIESLKLDRRLSHRRGWIEEQELASALEALPDAAGKATTGEEEAGEQPSS